VSIARRNQITRDSFSDELRQPPEAGGQYRFPEGVRQEQHSALVNTDVGENRQIGSRKKRLHFILLDEPVFKADNVTQAQIRNLLLMLSSKGFVERPAGDQQSESGDGLAGLGYRREQMVQAFIRANCPESQEKKLVLLIAEAKPGRRSGRLSFVVSVIAAVWNHADPVRRDLPLFEENLACVCVVDQQDVGTSGSLGKNGTIHSRPLQRMRIVHRENDLLSQKEKEEE